MKSSKPDPIVIFQQAFEAEHGLNQEIDLEKAKKLYKQAFNHGKGYLRAGNYLARIYQKENREKEAISIYQVIASMDEKIDPVSFAYAKYRLSKNQERQILQEQQAVKNIADEDAIINKTSKLIKEYDNIIALDEKYAPNSPAHAKALYHKAILKLEIVKYAENILLDRFDDEKSLADNNYEIIILEKELKENLRIIPEIAQAKELLKEAAKMDYPAAKAELINIKARSLSQDPKNNNEIIRLCDDALKLNRKNINAKLIKSDTLLQLAKNKEAKNQYYDESLKLLREALEKDPKHPVALKKKDALVSELIDNITAQIIENISDKSESFVPTIRPFVKLNQEKRRVDYIGQLRHKIKKSLSDEAFFSNYALFSEQNKIVAELNKDIWPEIETYLKKIIVNDATERKARVEEIITDKINKFATKQIKDPNLTAGHLLDNRNSFRDKIITELNEYHQRCAALTKPGSDLEARLNATWASTIGDSAQVALPSLAAFLGPTRLGFGFGVAAAAIKVTQDQINLGRKETLFRAAKKFCSIGEENGHRSKGYSARAEKQFEKIADKLVETYGMQIDNIKPTEIDKLAIAATEKMLNHVNNSTSLYKTLKTRLSDPLTYMESLLSTVEPTEENYVNQLLEGIITGQSTLKEAVIATKDPRAKAWLADDIFEKPAITSDGEHFYCNEKSDPSTYGAKYVSFIPTTYKEKKIDLDSKNKIYDEFVNHKRLMNLSDQLLPEKKMENKVTNIVIDQIKFAKYKRRSWRAYISGVIEGILGGLSIYTAGVLGMASSLGFHPAAAIPIAAAAGVSASVILPIAIATFAVVGVTMLARGVSNTVKAADEIEKIDSHQIRVVNEIKAEKEPKNLEAIKHEQHRQRAEQLAAKIGKNAKYVSGVTEATHVEKTEPQEHKFRNLANLAVTKLGRGKDAG